MPVPAPVSEPAPVVPPVPPTLPTPPAPGSTNAPGYGSGGWLGGISVANVGMILLSSLALMYVIYYNRLAIKSLKSAKSQDRKEIEELKGNVMSFMGENYKSY